MIEDKSYSKKIQSSLNLLDSRTGQKGVLLISGGLDSMSMLDALLRFKPDISWECLHINYQLRGIESDTDEAFIVNHCRQLGVPLKVKRVHLKQQTGIQEQARQIRYLAARDLAPLHGWNFALSAHHGDDQLETILMRLGRGCHLRGLQGIHQKRYLGDLPLLRPWITVMREDIRQYALHHHIEFREDSSNASSKYWRNRVRHGELDSFKKDWAGFLPSILQKSLEIQTYISQTEVEVEKLFKQYQEPIRHNFPKNIFWEIESTTRFLVIEKLLRHYGFKKECSEKLITEIESLITRQKGRMVLGKSEIVVRGNTVCFYSFQKKSDFKEVLVNGPGDYLWGPLTIKIRTLSLKESSLISGHKLLLNSEKLTWPLLLREKRPGDRFHPFGRPGSKKVGDFLIDQKIAKELRPAHPLLISDGRIACLVGMEIDNKFQVDDTTQQVISLFCEAKP